MMSSEDYWRKQQDSGLRDGMRTDLPFLFIVELVAKRIFLKGPSCISDLCSELKLALSTIEHALEFMRGQKLAEVKSYGFSNKDKHIAFDLSESGRARATEFLSRNAYVGVAPVTLDSYRQRINAQRVKEICVLREDIARHFADMVIQPKLLDQVGAAMNSGRAIFIYGPAGSGKTYLAERLTGLLKDDIWVPHAIFVDGEVVQVYDPGIHVRLDEEAQEPNSLDKRNQPDPRWVRCRRPTVLTGGELSMNMLELQFDEATRYYQAPPHLKANNGIFIIDDFGRQRCSPVDLINRWIVPLDRRIDFLALHTGHKFMVPFDVIVVFSSNVPPHQLNDGAFSRRLGYKIYVGEQSEKQYEQIFRKACEQYAVPWSDTAFHYLLESKHYAEERPLLACYPRDIVSQIRDIARYEGRQPEMNNQVLDRAWNNYFDTA